MGMAEKRAAKIVALAQAQIQEPVLSAALFLQKGRSGAMMAGGLVGMAIHSATKSAEGFAPTNILAVTQSGLYAFRASNNLGIKIHEPIGYWPWGAFGASTRAGGMTKFLFLGWGNGAVSALETQTLGVQSFQGAVVDEIVGRAAATGAIPPPPV